MAVALCLAAIAHYWRIEKAKESATKATLTLKSGSSQGEVPDLEGYSKLQTILLPLNYRAALYRSTVSSLGLATGRFVIFDRAKQPVVKLDTLEGVKDPWTQVYDFAGRNGLPNYATGGYPVYTRQLSGDGKPDLIVGQFSGGNQCCTTATIIELGKTSPQIIGQINDLNGWPFQGLEVRQVKGPGWQLIAHRLYGTSCGAGTDSADVVRVYSFGASGFADHTSEFEGYLESVLKSEVAQWKQSKMRTIGLLQTITAQYSVLGFSQQAQKFFQSNSSPFDNQWEAAGTNPHDCSADLTSFGTPPASSNSTP